ncbi:MAG: DNA repair protein RadA [Clostridiales bacterium]|nr:DNA repair protein RadA [Candidatus Equinaster intestinalis]
MPNKAKTVFVCNSCGYESIKWAGKCPQCNEWNTFEEQVIAVDTKSAAKRTVSYDFAVNTIDNIPLTSEHRFVTGMGELDRVLGGGIVKGSVVLLSGDPGIGKSTILLQMCNALKKLRILYVSGEESAVQIKLRAQRLGVENPNLYVMTNTDVEVICEYIKSDKPDLVMIDSIQTMNLSELSASSGSIVQVRECTKMLLATGKSLDIPVFIVGHVNKGGDIAGPKILEHIVDTVLYFEGESDHAYRLLRAVKNRFGSTNEIGVFEMNDAGLSEVENPSAMLLSGRIKNVSGDCVTSVIEGTRPILAEVQGLVSSTGFGNPRRTSAGFDYNRLNLILAVLEKRQGLYFSNLDAYVNIVGGLHLEEPAADLAVALSLVSSLRDAPIDDETVCFGEIGLSGEIRAVARTESRIKEAERLGFKRCVIPKANLKNIPKNTAIEIIGVKTLAEAINAVL